MANDNIEKLKGPASIDSPVADGLPARIPVGRGSVWVYVGMPPTRGIFSMLKHVCGCPYGVGTTVDEDKYDQRLNV